MYVICLRFLKNKKKWNYRYDSKDLHSVCGVKEDMVAVFECTITWVRQYGLRRGDAFSPKTKKKTTHNERIVRSVPVYSPHMKRFRIIYMTSVLRRPTGTGRPNQNDCLPLIYSELFLQYAVWRTNHSDILRRKGSEWMNVSSPELCAIGCQRPGGWFLIDWLISMNCCKQMCVWGLLSEYHPLKKIVERIWRKLWHVELQPVEFTKAWNVY